MIRIAFPFIRKSIWAGGYNYLLNLFFIISLYRSKELKPVLFYGTDIDKNELDDFRKIKNVEFVKSSLMNKSRFFISLTRSIIFGSDKKIKLLFNKHKINVIFEIVNFFGKKIDTPVIAWIPDVQHHVLPQIFPWITWWKREIGFRTQIRSGRSILLSSHDSKKAFKKYYPKSTNLVNLVRFAIQLKNIPSISLIKSIKKKYSLPDRYFYMPNQFYKHKNHITVLKSLILLREKGYNIVVVSSGKQLDPKNPYYFKEFYNELIKNKLEKNFILLGIIPYKHVLPMMMGSIAVLNPSLYEGRSTTVEESLALKVPLVLSDIKIHKEQANDEAKFFARRSFISLAKVLLIIWNKKKKSVIIKNLLSSNSKRVKIFANDFFISIKKSIDYHKNKS